MTHYRLYGCKRSVCKNNIVPFYSNAPGVKDNIARVSGYWGLFLGLKYRCGGTVEVDSFRNFCYAQQCWNPCHAVQLKGSISTNETVVIKFLSV